jgi:hypothetical protein
VFGESKCLFLLEHLLRSAEPNWCSFAVDHSLLFRISKYFDREYERATEIRDL